MKRKKSLFTPAQHEEIAMLIGLVVSRGNYNATMHNFTDAFKDYFAGDNKKFSSRAFVLRVAHYAVLARRLRNNGKDVPSITRGV